MQLLAGIARKVSIPFVVLAIIGWVLFVIGFALHNDGDLYESLQDQEDNLNSLLNTNADDFPDHRAGVDYFPFWCFIVAGPILFLNTFLHLIIGRWFTGIFTYFATALYLVCGGAVIFNDAFHLFSDSDRALNNVVEDEGFSHEDFLTDKDLGLYLLIEWIGSTVSVLFMTIYMMMWPLFSDAKAEDV